MQEVGGGLPALPQCIMGQGKVELEVREAVGLGTRLSMPQEVQTFPRSSYLHIGSPEVKGTGPQDPRVLELRA